MLAQLSARLRARQAAGGGGEGEDDGVPIMVDDNCSVGLYVYTLIKDKVDCATDHVNCVADS